MTARHIMPEPHTTKARDWYEAKLRGERLPPHELLPCDLCPGLATRDDYVPEAGLIICPACIERMVENGNLC